MALILKKEFENGIVLDETYHKIESVNCINFDESNMNIMVAIYKDKASRNESKKAIEYNYYDCKHNVSIDSKNSIAQAYEHLKLLDEYNGAIDDLL